MFEALIDLLNTLGRVPGLGKAFALRDALREGRYRRARVTAQVNGSLRLLKSTRHAGADFLAAVKTPARPGAEPATPTDDASRTQTLLRLRPAGRNTPMHAETAPPAEMPRSSCARPLRGSALNPLVDAGTELLTLATPLRGLASHPDMRQLRIDLASKVTVFHAAARRAGAAPEHVMTARYALCALLDEAVLTTPWGADSPWSQHSLLTQFHNETWGGEKFFHIVEQLLADPARHRPVLEFMYLCITLGMQGKYRVADGGLTRLEDVKSRVYQAIRRVRGEPARELSEHWQGAAPKRSRLMRVVPPWVVAALSAVLLLGAYAGFSLSLGRQAEPVYAALARIGEGPAQTTTVAMPAVPRTLTLREALATDIRDGRIDVIEQARGSTIQIHGDGFFASGRAEIDPALAPLLARVAGALNPFDSALLVTGHTDNQPVAMSRRLRFASNWELSQARAAAVAAALARQLDRPARLSAEGRGDAEPMAANDSAAHRAQNRRVEITLLSGRAASTPSTVSSPVSSSVSASLSASIERLP